jgi:hypothetical protein
MRRTQREQFQSGMPIERTSVKRAATSLMAYSGHRQRTMYSPIIVTELIVLLEA